MFFKLAKIFLYATPFAVVLVTTTTLFPFIVGKYAFFRSAVDLALIFCLLGLAMDPESRYYLQRLKQLFRSPLVIAVSAFVLMFLLAGFFGLRPAFSFWSNFERGEGGLQMLNLYVYMLLLATLFRREEEWRRLFWLSIIAAVLMVGYGVGAGLKYQDAGWSVSVQGGAPVAQLNGQGGTLYQTFQKFVGPWWKDHLTGKFDPSYRFQGTIGNAAYVAAYLLFILFYLAILFVHARGWRSNKKMILYGALFLLFGFVFYLSGTRGGILGLFAGAVVFLLVLAYSRKSWRKWVLGLVVLMVLVLGILISLRHNPTISKLPGMRIFDISLSTAQINTTQSGTFSTRTIMWSIAWNAWKQRPLLGYGPENFIWVFDRYFDTRYFVPAQGFGAWFDRAHSIVFDYLAETGILGLLSFLSIFGVLAWMILREKRIRAGESDSSAFADAAPPALVAGLGVAYLVQAIILFDVLTIYQNLFIFFAFALFLFIPQPDPATAKKQDSPLLYGGVIAGVILAFLAMYLGALLPYVKASRYIDAEQSASTIKDENDFETHFNQVLQFYSPVGGEEVPKFLSGDISGLLPRLEGPTAEPVARALINYIEPYMNKDDVRHDLVMAQMYYTTWHNFHHAEDFAASENYFLTAHNIGPKLPQPMYGLATIYIENKQLDKAQAIEKEILALWPDAGPTLPVIPKTK